MDYQQPDFYHFNQDSIWLANWVATNHKRPIYSLLDLCAGSGVIGIEIAQKRQEIKHLILLEMQTAFGPSLAFNLQHFLAPHVKREVYWESLGHFLQNPHKNSYDCIVVNPPYYSVESSRLSPILERRLCRHFLVDGLDVLIELFLKLKNDNNNIYMVYDEGQIQKSRFKKMFVCLALQDKIGIYEFCK